MREGVSDIPLNMEPIAPFLSNTLLPVPVVFSPAAGFGIVSHSTSKLLNREYTYDLVDRLMDATREVLVFHGGVGALLH